MDLGKSVKLVIFDFDGTLFHINPDWRALGKALGTDGTDETMGAALQRHRSEGNYDRIEAANAVELAAVTGRKLDADIIAALERLAKTYQLAVFSRNSRKTIEYVTAGTPLESKLYIIGREDTANLKPHPEGLELILRHFGVEPDEAVLVGDTDHDVIVAHDFGVPAVIVENPNLKRRPEGADYYIQTIGDLAQAGN